MLPLPMASQSVEILTGHAVWSLLAGIRCWSISVTSKGNSSIEADMNMIIDSYS